MARRRRICLVSCLALAGIFFYAWSSLNDPLWLSNDRSRLLAEDATRAAFDSVYEAMWFLLESYEGELRTASEWSAMDHSGTRFEPLQATLDNLLQELPCRNTTLEELSRPRSVKEGHAADTRQVEICRSLAGKRITMIGGEHIYRLHVLLLQHRERAEGRLFPCTYHEFCAHHHICLPYQHFRGDTLPPRYMKPPTMQELIETESAVVNYIVSDTLFAARNQSSWEYNLPFVDPLTGVRLRETYWLPAARKANVIILGRGPLSAPGETYTGNWSFLRYIPDYVDKSRAVIAGEYASLGTVYMYHTDLRSLEILNAAVHLTASRFLPDIFQLLRSIRHEVRPSKGKRLIWPSNWYRLPGRGVARTMFLYPHVRSKISDMIQRISFHHRRPRLSAEQIFTLQLSALIDADVTNMADYEDPWALLFNAQVYLQNIVLRELLPRYGIVFVPLDIPWVEDAQTRRHGHSYSHDAARELELERSAEIGEAFLTGMDYILRYLE